MPGHGQELDWCRQRVCLRCQPRPELLRLDRLAALPKPPAAPRPPAWEPAHLPPAQLHSGSGCSEHPRPVGNPRSRAYTPSAVQDLGGAEQGSPTAIPVGALPAASLSNHAPSDRAGGRGTQGSGQAWPWPPAPRLQGGRAALWAQSWVVCRPGREPDVSAAREHRSVCAGCTYHGLIHIGSQDFSKHGAEGVSENACPSSEKTGRKGQNRLCFSRMSAQWPPWVLRL